MTALDGTTVLITGASGGFGQQMIRQFLAAGSRLVLTDLDAAALEPLAGAIRAEVGGSGDILAVLPADLSTREGCESLYRGTMETTVPDILVNNAGIGLAGRIDQIPWQKWEGLLQVNLISVMRLTALFLPHMLERRCGHIVNISSIAAWVGSSRLSAYSASKFGVRGFSESLLGDLEDTPVRVTTVYPFFSRTPILDSEQFGDEPRRRVPDDIVTDPANVVGEILQGIRKDRAHVFPDKTARRLHIMKRLFPWLVTRLGKRMEERSLAE